jgi:cysteine desulfurase
MSRAREQVLSVFGVSDGWKCVFTSGASESINFALKGIAFHLHKLKRNRPIRLLTSPVEHGAVDKCLDWLQELLGPDGFVVEKVSVDSHGVINIQELEERMNDSSVPVDLVTFIHTVAETGAVQPIQEVSRIIKTYHPKSLFHCDASQSVGKLRNELLYSLPSSCDLITVAGHKFHAPKGIGALLLKDSVAIDPLIHGAGQEFGLRGGTENVACIVGLGKACEIATLEATPFDHKSILKAWKRFEAKLTEAGVDFRLNSTAPERSPFTLNFSVNGLDGPSLVREVGNQKYAGRGINICFSAGSACHSRGMPAASKVLNAMGLDSRYSTSGIRLSLGKLNKEEEVEEAFILIASHIINSLKS